LYVFENGDALKRKSISKECSWFLMARWASHISSLCIVIKRTVMINIRVAVSKRGLTDRS
jgi:hypothetical protein